MYAEGKIGLMDADTGFLARLKGSESNSQYSSVSCCILGFKNRQVFKRIFFGQAAAAIFIKKQIVGIFAL